jgi:Tfp pilus assembly protein FimT
MTELMVTVVIVGILIAVAVPSLAKVSRRDEIRRVARSAAEVFHAARAEAASSGRAFLIHIIADATTGAWSVAAYAQGNSSCLGTNTTVAYYEDGATTDRVAMVPKDPLAATSFIMICMKPNGRLYEYTGGAEFPFSGTLTVDVSERKVAANGASHQVRIGMSGLAKVY